MRSHVSSEPSASTPSVAGPLLSSVPCRLNVHDIVLAVEVQHRVRRKADMSRRGRAAAGDARPSAARRHDLGVAGIAERSAARANRSPSSASRPSGEVVVPGDPGSSHRTLRIEVDRVSGPGHNQRAVGCSALKFPSGFDVRVRGLQKHPCNGVVIFVNRRRFKHAPPLAASAHPILQCGHCRPTATMS